MVSAVFGPGGMKPLLQRGTCGPGSCSWDGPGQFWEGIRRLCGPGGRRRGWKHSARGVLAALDRVAPQTASGPRTNSNPPAQRLRSGNEPGLRGLWDSDQETAEITARAAKATSAAGPGFQVCPRDHPRRDPAGRHQRTVIGCRGCPGPLKVRLHVGESKWTGSPPTRGDSSTS